MRSKKLIVGVTVGISAWSFLRGQLSWFQEKDWEVVLVTSPDANAEKASKREKVRLEEIPMSREISLFKDLISLFKWIHLLKVEKPMAVNVGTPKAGLLGTIAAFLTRVPKRLYVVRGLRLEGVKSRPLHVVLWSIEKLTMLLATDVLFVSDSLAAEAIKLNLAPLKKSWLIGEGSSNGVSAELVSQVVSNVNTTTLRESLGIEPSQFVVGFIGRITADKGVDLLIDAVDSALINEQVRILFVGGVEDEKLSARVDALGSKAIMVSWTSEPWKYLSVMDVLCLPSLREGFPNVVLEAASAGIPSIVTSATGAKDSVIDGVTGRVLSNRDSKELTQIINELNSDYEKRRKLGENAQKRAVEAYKPETIWNGLLEIIEGTGNEKFARRVK